MRYFWVGVFVFSLVAVSLSYAQSEGWLPITPQDLQVKEVPGDPGAPAIQLYYAHYINDNYHSQFFYRRIKILNDKGNKYADVEIPILIPGSSVSDLKARTIHPDGKIIDFTGKAFEKTMVKGQGLKYLAKTFTFPEVTAGSIVEYKYLIMMPEDSIYDSHWTIQHDLYTLKEGFSIKAYKGRLQTKHGGDTQLSVVYSNMPSNLKPQKKNEGVAEMQAANIAAFQAEDYMPPEQNYEPQVRFYYGGADVSSPEKFWQQVDRDWNKDVEGFIGNHSEIQKAAADAIGLESDWDQQVRKLYARAQQIRNLTYERERTREELKKEALKPNSNVVDVLNHGYGTRRDIVLFFAALARASRFPTSILMVSNRSERFFDRGLLSEDQLDSIMAVVKVNGQDVYLDPGTKFCPYGLVRWIRTSTAALKLDKDGGTFVIIPVASYDKATLNRNAMLTLAENGTLSGDLTVQFLGGEALEHRLEALDTDEAGRKKDLEEQVKQWLSSEAIVNLTKSDGWEGEDTPLIAVLHIEIPGYASTAGKRLLLPPYVFLTKRKDAFKYADRKYPVYFPYAYGENDVITIKLPSGYSIEGAPKSEQAKVSYAAYQTIAAIDSGNLVTQRRLLFNGIFFDTPKYPELKDFFSKVQAGDEQQAVLRVGGATSVQKSN